MYPAPTLPIGGTSFSFGSLLTRTNILIALAVLALIGFLVYYFYVVPQAKTTQQYKPNSEHRELGATDDEKSAELLFFYADWCPHCKTAKPIWDEYTEKNQNIKVGNYTVLFKSVDCDSAEGKPLADAFNVKGYPSFKLERSPGDVVDFEAKPSEDNFNSLLQSSLQ